jgi:hypothetical protein
MTIFHTIDVVFITKLLFKMTKWNTIEIVASMIAFFQAMKRYFQVCQEGFEYLLTSKSKAS